MPDVDLRVARITVRSRGLTASAGIEIPIRTSRIKVKSRFNSFSIVTPSDTKYINSQQWRRANVIYGVNDIFKLNKTAAPVLGKTNVIHLSQAKPDIVTVQKQFTLQTFTAHLDIYEWVYETADGYLRITNAEEVSTSLVVDGSTYEIPMTAVDAIANDFVIGITF
jgi:hypothetical protein